MRALLPTVPAKNVQEGQTASHLSSPSHQTMSCPSQYLLAPGLRWLACTPTPTGDLAGLQSEHRGTDPCSVTARTGPPWPQALESSAPPCSRQAAAPLPCLRPDLSPLTESIHSALPASLSLVSPMPLTPLDAVLSTMSVPGAVRRRHTVSPSTLWAFSAPAPGMQCHVGPAQPQAGPTAASLLQKSLWSPLPAAALRSLQVMSFRGLPRTLRLRSRSPALEAPAQAWEAWPEPLLYLLLNGLQWV